MLSREMIQAAAAAAVKDEDMAYVILLLNIKR